MNTWGRGRALPLKARIGVDQTQQLPMLNRVSREREKTPPGCTPPDGGAPRAAPGRTPRQTPPHPPRLCLREKNNPRPSILRCQPPTQLLRGPGPARGAHTHPLRSHPDTYTNRAPSTRAHTHRGHAGTAAPLPHKGWRARGHTQPRAGTLAVPSPRRHPAAAHPHPRVPGAPWGPPLLTPKPVGMKCRQSPTPLPLRCGESRLQHPLPLRGPNRPRLQSSPIRLGPHTWPRCGVRLVLGPQTLTCPAPLWGRPCASLLRLREPRPPARHISRNRGGGKKGEGWRGKGGLRVPSFPRPSTAATNQKLKKKKK